MSFPDFLRARMDAACLSPAELATGMIRAGTAITPGAIRHWLNGRSVPASTQLDALATALDVAPGELTRALAGGRP